MPAWWDSLETVNNVTWWLKWVGAGLTFTGAICVIATLATTKRSETLKASRDETERAKAAKTAEEAAGRTSKLEVDLAEQQKIAPEYQSELQALQKTVPRRITPEERIALVTALKPFAGQHVMIAQLRATDRPWVSRN
jgi:hypothetical protein